MDNTNKTRRLFFALWPDEPTRLSIVESFSQFTPAKNARVLPPNNFHMTLHFIGQVTDEVKHNLHLAAQKIHNEKFVIDLDCFGYFSTAKIFWMGCKQPPAALLQLHENLANALEGDGYTSETSTYTPHVSLMRRCAESEAIRRLENSPPFSILWKVNEFVLVESQGGNYRVIERYPFS